MCKVLQNPVVSHQFQLIPLTEQRSSVGCWVKSHVKTPPNHWATAIARAHQNLMVRFRYTCCLWSPDKGEIKLVLARKLPSFPTGYQSWKVLCGLLWGEKASANLPSCELCILDFYGPVRGLHPSKHRCISNAKLNLGEKDILCHLIYS